MAEEQPKKVIIKKIKKNAHGNHGGAWKVAYADFVTAMMAFFLMLWLLNQSSDTILKGIAEYFTPTIGLVNSSGIGTQGGKDTTLVKGSSTTNDHKSDAIIYGAPMSGAVITMPKKETDQDNKLEQDNFLTIEQNLKDAITKNSELNEYKDNIAIYQTPEGLRISIYNKDDKPMFKLGTADMYEPARKLLQEVTKLIKYIPNYISIGGHTNSIIGPAQLQDNWELSGRRADKTRVFMVESGLDSSQIARLVSYSDRDPKDISNPNASENIRITITLLKNSILSHRNKIGRDTIIEFTR